MINCGTPTQAKPDERVRVWEVESGRLMRTVAFSAPVGGVSVSPDGQTVAVACPRLPAVALCDAASGEGFGR